MNTLLDIQNLTISFKGNEVIHGISYALAANEILGIVGESGSGKSVSSLAILGLLPKKNAEITGTILYEDQNLVSLRAKDFQRLRGNEISMIFQEPMSSLNPSMTCGKQVEEVLLQHKYCTKKAVKAEVLGLFEKVKLPRVAQMYSSYPHQLSGGQKQRVVIAMAIACKPKVLIADEPTTALDVTVQKEIILLLKELQQENQMGIIFISHDLSLVSEIADQIVVMYQGNIVERGETATLFSNPQHEYTKALLKSKPSLDVRLKKLPTIQDVLAGTVSDVVVTTAERQLRHENMYTKAPLLEVKNVSKSFYSNASLFGKSTEVKAVDDVSFSLYEGETLGLVGESGCGKSTLGNVILQLHKATEGQILYKGVDITKISKYEVRALRKEIQIIFQDPFASLNPRIPVGAAILEPMKVHGLHANDAERKEKVIELLERVRLDASYYGRYPHEFSGGQRQRIGIARTIALQPKLIICDESVSALDISVQAQVLNLLNELKDNFGFTYIFISHDLAVVKYIADQLLVMNDGRIEELGEADAIYANPKSSYTQTLIDAIPKGI
ncbi:ABC transporter ATP-binding protein [Kordia sp. YSTF-M3]|uniref:ABC transporter ATP-binding protein n=1 Tax=Kordia aestuariivivens TaxID=2759037 RepID=A0ABR7Q9S6_9FLAO|nr:ABC transporter ATP-binding protein [Kordia aestuariivivens]MBC8755248.1 ABC transporter ATP-binding protein [Kordia aestuariivivens]